MLGLRLVCARHKLIIHLNDLLWYFYYVLLVDLRLSYIQAGMNRLFRINCLVNC